jgi:hypothetical protein
LYLRGRPRCRHRYAVYGQDAQPVNVGNAAQQPRFNALRVKKPVFADDGETVSYVGCNAESPSQNVPGPVRDGGKGVFDDTLACYIADTFPVKDDLQADTVYRDGENEYTSRNKSQRRVDSGMGCLFQGIRPAHSQGKGAPAAQAARPGGAAGSGINKEHTRGTEGGRRGGE